MVDIKDLMNKEAFTQVMSDADLKKIENMTLQELIDNKYITDGSYRTLVEVESTVVEETPTEPTPVIEPEVEPEKEPETEPEDAPVVEEEPEVEPGVIEE